MTLDSFDIKTTCLSSRFFGATQAELKNKITNDNELEDKTTLAFLINGEPASVKEYLEYYNANNPTASITYVGALMEKALANEGIISFGTELTKPHTKNLVSYCFDDENGSLSERGVTLRVRHEEYRDSTGQRKMLAPDISTKFMLTDGDTSSRAEFERTSDFAVDDNNQLKFHLTLLGIIEQQVDKSFKNHGAVRAMEWLQSFTSMVGFDFSDKREKTNINCRRTQPYAVMHTRKDHEGNLLRDEKTGKPKLFKPADVISKEDHLRGVRPANTIVFMFCLDVNRVFAPGSTEKIECDNEWEHEHQDHACGFTPGSIKSTDGVTREEIDVMDDYLKALKAKVMRENGIVNSCLSGMNKDARAHIYVKRRCGDVVGNELTVRGQNDNFVMQRVDGFQDLLTKSPLIKKVYDLAMAERILLPVHAVK